MGKKIALNREKFCNYYIECGNASEAYRKAYPRSVGWKEGVVKSHASALLKNEDVAMRLGELRDEASKEFDMKKQDALRYLAKIVAMDPIHLQHPETMEIKALKDIPENVRVCIQSIETTKDGVRVKLYSKIAALTLISKMLGWDAPVKNENNTNMRIVIGDD